MDSITATLERSHPPSDCPVSPHSSFNSVWMLTKIMLTFRINSRLQAMGERKGSESGKPEQGRRQYLQPQHPPPSPPPPPKRSSLKPSVGGGNSVRMIEGESDGVRTTKSGGPPGSVRRGGWKGRTQVSESGCGRLHRRQPWGCVTLDEEIFRRMTPRPPPCDGGGRRSIEECIKQLQHATRCDGCHEPACARMKQILRHSFTCATQPPSCQVCMQLVAVVIYHARRCWAGAECDVPRCFLVKERLRVRSLRQAIKEHLHGCCRGLVPMPPCIENLQILPDGDALSAASNRITQLHQRWSVRAYSSLNPAGRQAVLVVLLTAQRLSATWCVRSGSRFSLRRVVKSLPGLPLEMWFHILGQLHLCELCHCPTK